MLAAPSRRRARLPLVVLALIAGCTGGTIDHADREPDGGETGDPGDRPDDRPDGDDDGREPDEAETTDLGGDPGPPVLLPGCTATGSLGGHPVWLHFTRPPAPCRPNPASEPGVDTHILVELIRLIDSVPAGGRIDGHIFNITVDAVAAALVQAQARGVEVWLSTDGQVGASTDSAKTTYLDQLVHKVYCGTATTDSCVSSADGAISHVKLFVFSAATAPDGTAHQDVTWFGSANQTRYSGMATFNNTVTIYGDAALYQHLHGYLDELFAQRRRTDFYDAAAPRGLFDAAAATAYASPEADTDLIVNRLNDVVATDACAVDVMQASIRDTRLDVVDLLVRLERGGCQVRVVAGSIDDGARARLRGAGIPMRQHEIHDKVFVVVGDFAAGRRHRVYTGSHNLSGSANRRFDELFVKLAAELPASHPVYDAYLSHFHAAFDGGTVIE